MGKTWKDSKKTAKSILEVVKRVDGTFDIFWDGKLRRKSIPERWLPQELCGGFGFCGEEYDSILRAVNQNGKAKVVSGLLQDPECK